MGLSICKVVLFLSLGKISRHVCSHILHLWLSVCELEGCFLINLPEQLDFSSRTFHIVYPFNFFKNGNYLINLKNFSFPDCSLFNILSSCFMDIIISSWISWTHSWEFLQSSLWIPGFVCFLQGRLFCLFWSFFLILWVFLKWLVILSLGNMFVVAGRGWLGS